MIHTQGTLSNGKKWLFDGDEVYTYSPERDEWTVPCWAYLTDGERDELSAIGAEMNALKDVAKDYGRAYIDAILADGGACGWTGLDFPAFYQVLANTNAPAFTPSDENGVPIEDIDGTIFELAARAAWEALSIA